MGAFLSKPLTDKVSADKEHQRLSFGVCSMQGWRFTQEDNHSCFPALDEACSLFGVYDGHGGGEVSRYVASLLPDYVLQRESWKEGDVGRALSEAFLALDSHLGSKKGLKVLKQLAAEDEAALEKAKDKNKSYTDDDAESEDGSEENVRNLFKEAKMPLEMLMAKYGQALAASRNAAESQDDSKGSPSASKSTKATKANAEEEEEEDEDEGEEEEDDKEKEEVKGEKKKVKQGGEDKEKDVKKKRSKKSEEEEKEGKEEEKEDVGGSSKGSKVKEEGSGEGVKATKEEPKENGLPEEGEEKSTITKNGSGGRTKLRSRQNRIVMTDDNDDEDDDSSDEEYDENSSSLMDEEGEEDGEEEEEEEEESSSGDDDEEVWIPKSDQFALKMLQGPGLDSGCTAVVAVLKEGGVLYVANAGDSRCILSRKGVAVDMSVDHKPEDEEESNRIKEAGGEVTSEGRVNGGLNLSRALGDHAYKQGNCGARKQMISALPDVRRIRLREDEDEFMVLACDGIWNSMTSQNVVDFVRERLFKGLPKGDKTKGAKELRRMTEGVKLSHICGEMFDYCLAPNTNGDGTGCDNMTAILVNFKEELWAKEEKCEGTAEEGGEDGIVLLTPPPSPSYAVEEEEDAAESSLEEEEEEILDDEDEEKSEEEEEVIVKNKGVGNKGCKRSSGCKESESSVKMKKQKLEEEGGGVEETEKAS